MFYCCEEIRKAQSRNLNVQLSSYININIIGNSVFWKKAFQEDISVHILLLGNAQSGFCLHNGLNETGED